LVLIVQPPSGHCLLKLFLRFLIEESAPPFSSSVRVMGRCDPLVAP
jgi:hypothetical protein